MAFQLQLLCSFGGLGRMAMFFIYIYTPMGGDLDSIAERQALGA